MKIPGVEHRSALAILAEIGTDRPRFSTPEQLARRARVCPGNHQSAGRKKSGRAGRGNPWLRAILVHCAWAASRDRDSPLAAQLKRLLHRGKKHAARAAAHSILNIVWHLLRRGVEYHELGAAYFRRQNLQGHTRSYVKKLAKLGYKVTLSPTAEGQAA